MPASEPKKKVNEALLKNALIADDAADATHIQQELSVFLAFEDLGRLSVSA